MLKRLTGGLLSLVMLTGVLMSCDKNGDIVVFSVEDDIALGKQVSDEIASKPDEYPVLPEEDYNEAYAYLRNNILAEVLQSDNIVYKDRFAYSEVKIIADDETLNAFATPGGYIYVYTGLIKYLDNEDQLAGVLGHEIAHADQRHTSKQLQTQLGVQILLDALLGDGQGAVSQVLVGLGSLKFGRDAETEADEFSVRYLADGKYSCTGAAGFFIKLESEGQGAGIPEFLSTHPSPDNRIQNIQATATEENCATANAGNINYQAFKDMLP